MDPTALVEPAAREVLGYGVLGVAVIALTVLFWFERRDRKDAEKAVDDVREAAALKIEELQNYRINEMRSAIDSIRKGDEVMDDLQTSVEKRLDAFKASIDALAGAMGRAR